jgi:hypothetical protein
MRRKLQKERSKNAAMMIDKKEGLLPSSKVVSGFKRRLKLCPLSLLVILG